MLTFFKDDVAEVSLSNGTTLYGLYCETDEIGLAFIDREKNTEIPEEFPVEKLNKKAIILTFKTPESFEKFAKTIHDWSRKLNEQLDKS